MQNKDERAPLQVQIVTAKKRESEPTRLFKGRILLLASFFGLILIFIVIWLWKTYLFYYQTQTVDCTKVIQGLNVFISYPTYLANGDEGEIIVTIINDQSNLSKCATTHQSNERGVRDYKTQEMSSNHSITGTVIVDFQDSFPVILSSETSSRVAFYKLAPGERYTKSVRFTLAGPPILIDMQTFNSKTNPLVKFNIHLAEYGEHCKFDQGLIKVASFYKLESLFTAIYRVGAVGVITALIGLVWGRVKKIFEVD